MVIGTASLISIFLDHIGQVMKAARNTARCRIAEAANEGNRLVRIGRQGVSVVDGKSDQAAGRALGRAAGVGDQVDLW